jgi:hypothetical protein
VALLPVVQTGTEAVVDEVPAGCSIRREAAVSTFGACASSRAGAVRRGFEMLAFARGAAS